MREYRQIKHHLIALMAVVIGAMIWANVRTLLWMTPLVGALLVGLVLFDVHFLLFYFKRPRLGWRYLFYGLNLLMGSHMLFLLSGFENLSVGYWHFLLVILAGFFFSGVEAYWLGAAAGTYTLFYMAFYERFVVLPQYTVLLLSAILLNGIHANLRLLIHRHNETIEEVRTLYKISNIIDTFPSTEEILERLVKIIAEALDIEQAYILLLDDTETQLEVVAKYGKDLAEERFYGIGSSLAGWVYENEVKVFVNDIAADDFVREKLQYDLGLSAIAVIPLIYQGFKFGVLITSSKEVHSFKKRDDRFLDMIAKRVSMVLYNNHLYRHMELSAKTDALTGLYNQRTFYEELERAVETIPESGGGLHLLLMDIDRFKSFNDRFGHVLGDEVLREIGGAIQASIREQDKAFRYGGEEFAVILHQVNDEEMAEVADRIRGAIRAITERIDTLKNAEEVITVSVGAARYPEDRQTLIHLVACADDNMYRAKEEGGDRLVS